MSVNIKQINLGNVDEMKSRDIIKKFNIQTKAAPKETSFTYAEIRFSPYIYKMGYCSDKLAMNFNLPIFLSFVGGEQNARFYVQPNGIFEFNPEDFKDINTVDSEEFTAIPYLTTIQVPYKYKEISLPFTIDYILPLN